ncbi:hypothetical protein BJF78_04940 [Pseudonocardia sp. CNS-139]|nr:hypothetical protein BJF78_04940 [Pseudonocardia sp. CNS-139]
MRTTKPAVVATVAFAWIATFGFGGLVIETLLLYPNIFADVPASLTRALEFMSVTAPNDVLPPLGAATLATALAAVALTLRRREVRLFTIGAVSSIALGELLFSAIWFWPRNTIMFVDDPALYDAAFLQQVAAEFQAGHWVRVAAGAITAGLAFAAMLRMHRIAVAERADRPVVGARSA